MNRQSNVTNSDFYVGYRSDNPAAQGRFTRNVCVIIVVFTLCLGAALASLMQPFDPGIFEFGTERTLEGRIQLSPQPTLQLAQPLERPSSVQPGSPYSEVLLVGFGKHGAREEVARFDGETVKVSGTLVAQNDRAMLELSSDPVAASAQVIAPVEPNAVGNASAPMTLVGEIVDSKCFLGVMKPGRGKSHKSCAALCIEGGVPPALLVRSEAEPDNPWIALLLNGEGQEFNQNLAPWVGRAVKVEGRLISGDAGATPQFWMSAVSAARE